MLETLSETLIVTIAVAIAGVFFARLRDWYKTRKIMRKYPLEGRYISYYEDEENGEYKTIKALVIIDQNRTSITGRTQNLHDNREWTVRAELLDGNYLSGVYVGSNPHDPGKGTFFLQLDVRSSEYAGIWAGYDSINKKVASGRYRWRRLEDGKIESLTGQGRRADQALSILGSSLGEKYIDRHQLNDYTRPELGHHASAAFMSEEVVGVQLSKVLSFEEASALDRRLDEEKVHTNLDCHRLGLLKSIAVRPSARGRGIGSNLTQDALRFLKEHDCTCVAAVAWESGGDEISKGMLMASGFREIAHVPRYWYQDSIDRSYDCSVCGNPCTCSAAILIRDL